MRLVYLRPTSSKKNNRTKKAKISRQADTAQGRKYGCLAQKGCANNVGQ